MWVTFLVNCYRKILNISLIALLIIAPIVGGVIGKLLGVLIGLAAVLVFEFFVVPPVIVLFEINENLKGNKKAENKTKEVRVYKAETKKEEPAPEYENRVQSNGWLCSHCGALNAINNTQCAACFKSK